MWPTLLVVLYVQTLTAKKVIYYADFEHPNVTYWNPKYCEYFTVTAQRYSRKDPIHYVNIRTNTLTVLGNDITMTYDAHEFLSNEYRPSMFVVTFKICDFFSDPTFAAFKPFYKNFFNASSCPFAKGEYNFLNFSIPDMPLLSTFPFRKARLFVSIVRGGERLAEVHIDIVIKQKFL